MGVASRINTLLRHYGTRVVLTGICFTHDFTGRSQHDFQTQAISTLLRIYVVIPFLPFAFYRFVGLGKTTRFPFGNFLSLSAYC